MILFKTVYQFDVVKFISIKHNFDIANFQIYDSNWYLIVKNINENIINFRLYVLFIQKFTLKDKNWLLTSPVELLKYLCKVSGKKDRNLLEIHLDWNAKRKITVFVTVLSILILLYSSTNFF